MIHGANAERAVRKGEGKVMFQVIGATIIFGCDVCREPITEDPPRLTWIHRDPAEAAAKVAVVHETCVRDAARTLMTDEEFSAVFSGSPVSVKLVVASVTAFSIGDSVTPAVLTLTPQVETGRKMGHSTDAGTPAELDETRGDAP